MTDFRKIPADGCAEQPPQPMPDDTSAATGGGKKPRKPLWRRILKWTGIAAAVAAGLFVLICSLIVWILTPGRLTPLVKEQASKYLDADLRVKRVELTFWHTFPKMTVEVDSLRIISRSLDNVPDSVASTLPADWSRLLSLGSFSGGINVLPLLKGDISLYDVDFHGIDANLVATPDGRSNFDIFPTSEEADTSALSLPSITINRFGIDRATVRYRTAASDTAEATDFTVNLEKMAMRGADAPRYHFNFKGDAVSPLLEQLRFSSLGFGGMGSVNWRPDSPLELRVDDFSFSVDSITSVINAGVDFSDGCVINELRLAVNDIPVNSLLRHVPAEYEAYTRGITTDMRPSLHVTLTKPWNAADTSAGAPLPSFRVRFDIQPSTVVYDGYRFSDVEALLTADFDGENPDTSEFRLSGLHLRGDAVDVSLGATATAVMTDPLVNGEFTGRIDIGRLPARLRAMIPVQISGLLQGHSTFRLRQSYLNRENFHRMRADGELTLTRLHADAQGVMTAYARHATLRFGTNEGFVAQNGQRVDSLLQVSLEIDTLAANGMGMNLEMSSFRAGIGTANRAASADTSEINPFGGRLTVARLKFDAPADTMHARLRDASIGASLRRFRGQGRSPLMDLKIDAARMMFGQALTKVSLTKADAALRIHLNEKAAARRAAAAKLTAEERQARSARRKARADSLRTAAGQQENVDFELSRSDKRLLRRWDFSGHVKAERGRLVTPILPLRNRVYNFNMTFNQDSIVLANTGLQAGQSDFLVNGTLSNLRRALTSRRDNTLRMDLRLQSDTVNVNEIVHALFAGAAISAKTDSTMMWGAENDDLQAERLASMADTTSTGPLLLPHNIDAHLRVNAANILYSDMVLHDFRGNLLLYDGALNLRNLSARTDIGSIGVNGLYSAPSPDSLQFGLGMKVHDFRLDRLTTLVPAIDSIMPMMANFAGTVNADIAVTTDLHPNMDINIPSLRAALRIEGDSLVLMDPATFKTVSKWLLFRNKNRNMIDHMAVEAVIENSAIEVYPFMFNIDRYQLGVMGHNDLAMNMDYHVSVLKSPIPFKFGINLRGNPDKMKVRLGGAKVKPGMVGQRQQIADNTRINLVQQIDNVFRRGISKARLGRLTFSVPPGGTPSPSELLEEDDRLSYADSLGMIRAGMIDNPDTLRFPPHDLPAPAAPSKSGKKAKK